MTCAATDGLISASHPPAAERVDYRVHARRAGALPGRTLGLETFQRDRGLRMQDTMTGQLAALLPPEPTIELDLLSIDANPVVCRAQIA
ncbi:hypothetical protein ACGFMK_36060 [Amycolatopsis sp. NPDC049252]|uniref:hypothetical protein n=1 Tax=Amycolatopsis sp. NPDC049252 TaxID=3363933 RepID=UPI00371CEF73